MQSAEVFLQSTRVMDFCYFYICTLDLYGEQESSIPSIFVICYHIDYLGMYHAYKDTLDAGTMSMDFSQNTVLF